MKNRKEWETRGREVVDEMVKKVSQEYGQQVIAVAEESLLEQAKMYK